MCIAIECSYKLDQKNELKFLCELCTFSQIRSHIRFWMFQCKQKVKMYLNNYVLNQKHACVNKALVLESITLFVKTVCFIVIHSGSLIS